ncbi:uncharacterized protein LACBIDRAFT_317493 [Laccaria bicolor S238N-H82]|uniref:Predicted protein n=1 Tax=Laccaria bicolor (strain S238N-H82 / ATCC MYA-4686) TaxID=486041 RepID=B0E1V2_LACBS|nr:uncharacterized protein LACBIDRAFT_317493 [Laccaria bicolor S238N-H82]EDQ99205.1 predicted protein [Laccaria bicolor S238N-H82]|eukprot:XP_001890172.1 predicted protein [Laccaria bicolor S238N-H82]
MSIHTSDLFICSCVPDFAFAHTSLCCVPSFSLCPPTHLTPLFLMPVLSMLL